MNFYKLNKLMNEMSPPNLADVTPGSQTSNAPQATAPASPDNKNLKQDMRSNLAHISHNLGEKGNKYQALIQYVGKNPSMLDLLDELLGDVGGMQASKFGNLYNK